MRGIWGALVGAEADPPPPAPFEPGPPHKPQPTKQGTAMNEERENTTPDEEPQDHVAALFDATGGAGALYPTHDAPEPTDEDAEPEAETEDAPEPEPPDADEPPETDDEREYADVDLSRPHRMEQRTLPCAMDDDELAKLALAMARILREIGRIETQHKRVKALREQAEGLAYKVESGIANRLVDVCVMFDTPTSGHKQSIRMDTGEVISTAPMEEHEYQQAIPFDEAEQAGEAEAEEPDAEEPNPLKLPVMDDAQ